MTQPTQVISGPFPPMSSQNTSTDSRSPWPTTYSVWMSPSPWRRLTPCGWKRAAGGPGQSPYITVSCRIRAPAAGNSTVAVWSRVSARYRWPSSAMLATTTSGVRGTAIRSSGLTGPQMNCTSPSGSQPA